MSDEFDPVSAAFAWWGALQHDKASAAQLRRASVAEACMHPAVADLWRRLGYKNPARLTRVAALATLLATIRSHDPQPFGRAIGRTNINDPASAALKIGRFQHLLRTDATDEEFAVAMRRAINIAGDRVNVGDIIRLCLFRENDNVRNRFALAYFGADTRAQTVAA